MITGPSWLAGVLAALMIAMAAGGGVRLLLARPRRLMAGRDADLMHVVMGVAMAGMLVPALALLPAAAWEGVFGMAAIWSAWRIARGWRGPAGPGRRGHHLAHLVGSGAMVFMAAAMPGPGPGGGAMQAMGGAASGAAGAPALALVLAVCLLGCAVVAAGELTAAPVPASPPGQGALAPRLAACGQVAMLVVMGYLLIGMV